MTQSAPKALTLPLAAASLALAALTGGCGDDRAVAPRIDGGPGADGGPDAGAPTDDGGPGTDAGPDADGGVGRDGGTFDPLPPSHDPWGDGDPDVCEGPSPPPTCETEADCVGQDLGAVICTEGLCACVPGGCGGRGYCTRRGATCSSDTSCGGPTIDSVCATAAGGGRFCRTPPGDPSACRGSWDCPAGFECEPSDGGETPPTSDGTVCASGDVVCACVDRRLPCRLDETEGVAGVCPVGYRCTREGNTGRPFCQRPRPCPGVGGETLCDEGEVCLDPTGADFGGVCVRQGTCATDADCVTSPDVQGDRCTMSVVSGRTICGFDPPCDPAAPECGANLSCNAVVHTVGTAFCHPTRPEGEMRANCQSDAECRPNARCIWLDGNPPVDPDELETEPLPYGECICFDPALGEAGGSQPCEGRPEPG